MKGAVITHVDDFTITGTVSFIEEVSDMIERELTISKIERDKFYFTGLNVSTKEDRIEIEMADYVASLQDIKDIRKADRDEELTKIEMKEFRKMTGKLSWLANSTHLDLSYMALAMSKKSNSAKISYLFDVA